MKRSIGDESRPSSNPPPAGAMLCPSCDNTIPKDCLINGVFECRVCSLMLPLSEDWDVKHSTWPSVDPSIHTHEEPGCSDPSLLILTWTHVGEFWILMQTCWTCRSCQVVLPQQRV